MHLVYLTGELWTSSPETARHPSTCRGGVDGGFPEGLLSAEDLSTYSTVVDFQYITNCRKQKSASRILPTCSKSFATCMALAYKNLSILVALRCECHIGQHHGLPEV